MAVSIFSIQLPKILGIVHTDVEDRGICAAVRRHNNMEDAIVALWRVWVALF
jgi:hypothetical protein